METDHRSRHDRITARFVQLQTKMPNLEQKLQMPLRESYSGVLILLQLSGQKMSEGQE